MRVGFLIGLLVLVWALPAAAGQCSAYDVVSAPDGKYVAAPKDGRAGINEQAGGTWYAQNGTTYTHACVCLAGELELGNKVALRSIVAHQFNPLPVEVRDGPGENVFDFESHYDSGHAHMYGRAVLFGSCMVENTVTLYTSQPDQQLAQSWRDQLRR